MLGNPFPQNKSPSAGSSSPPASCSSPLSLSLRSNSFLTSPYRSWRAEETLPPCALVEGEEECLRRQGQRDFFSSQRRESVGQQLAQLARAPGEVGGEKAVRSFRRQQGKAEQAVVVCLTIAAGLGLNNLRLFEVSIINTTCLLIHHPLRVPDALLQRTTHAHCRRGGSISGPARTRMAPRTSRPGSNIFSSRLD